MQPDFSGMIRGILLALAMTAASLAMAFEVAGMKVPDSAQVDGKTLPLNGAGIRTKLFFKVYAAALYAEKPSREAAALIVGPERRRIVMTMLRELDADTLYGALEDGLQKNSSESERAALKPSIDALAATMHMIGKVVANDTVTLDFLPEGVSIAHNNEPRGKIADARIGPALLKVWLGEKPADVSLKQALLGR